ncbi:hypothetical protein H4R19_004689 [Coemansia spiralis]|nr:hypothetical protein H4R19_004689 [Coemansia spiralis]
MSSIAAEPVHCYTPYGLAAAPRRDNADPTVSAGAAHALFNHHAAGAQVPHHQHQPRPPHVVIPQYHAPHLQTSAASAHRHIPATTPDGAAAAVVAYPSGAFVPYTQAMHHAHRPAGAHQPDFGQISGAGSMAITPNATVDQDYSVMAVAGAWCAPQPPVGLPQQQPQQQQQHPQQHLMYHGPSNPNMRLDCILEAQTAAAQKADDSSLTYLNKGQLYGFTMIDKVHSDAFYSTTLRVAFHEDSHRKSAGTYWTFWLNQQDNPRVARAVDLDKAGSIGVIATDNSRFDRVTFQWQGCRGVKVMVRFNCLSTDFSRIKGVKGIPLRIHLDTHYAVPQNAAARGDAAAAAINPLSPEAPLKPADPAATSQSPAAPAMTPVSPTPTHGHAPHHHHTDSSVSTFSTATGAVQTQGTAGVKLVSGELVERCCARIKLFRDKGAERKNKDDQRHMDKMWTKQKTKLALNSSSPAFQQQQLAEFTMTFAPVQPVTPFVEYTLADDECDLDDAAAIDDDMWLGDGTPFSAGFAAPVLESPGSLSATPVAGMSSMNIGIQCASLGVMSMAPDSAMAAASIRKRVSEDAESLESSKRRYSSPSLSLPGTSRGVEVVGVDPTYVPAARKRTPVRVVYVRFRGESVYRAVYLDELTADDLVVKLAQRLEIQTAAAEVEVVRKTKKGLTVKVDDHVVAQLDDEQDMEVACSFARDTGALTIYLHY